MHLLSYTKTYVNVSNRCIRKDHRRKCIRFPWKTFCCIQQTSRCISVVVSNLHIYLYTCTYVCTKFNAYIISKLFFLFCSLSNIVTLANNFVGTDYSIINNNKSGGFSRRFTRPVTDFPTRRHRLTTVHVVYGTTAIAYNVLYICIIYLRASFDIANFYTGKMRRYTSRVVHRFVCLFSSAALSACDTLFIVHIELYSFSYSFLWPTRTLYLPVAILFDKNTCKRWSTGATNGRRGVPNHRGINRIR